MLGLRISHALGRGVLLGLLTLTVALGGCDATSAKPSGPYDGNGRGGSDDSDDPILVDDDLEDDDGDDETGSVADAGSRDASANRDAGKGAGKDASGPDPKPDAGRRDAGDDAPSGDGSTPTPATDAGGGTPSGAGLIRGDAPTEASASKRGPFDVKTYTSGYRDGPAYADSTIHYPTNAEPPFASIAIVPGFVSPQSSIQTWGPFLASHGIVTMTIGTNSPSDPPPARQKALLDALETIKSEQTRSGSPLAGKLDLGRLATGGWSMGGGGTLLAGESTPTLKATMAMCAWNPGGRYPKMKVPTLMFAGTADVLAGGQSQGFYQSIPESTPKLLWEVQGADHFFANNPAGQGGAIGRYGLSFLKVFLEGDERYRPFLKVKGPKASDFRTNM